MFNNLVFDTRTDSTNMQVVWVAGTLTSNSSATATARAFRRLSKKELSSVSLKRVCAFLAAPPEPMALRLSSNLMYGASRVLNSQMSFLWNDANNVFVRLKKVFSDASTGASITMLTVEATSASITLHILNEDDIPTDETYMDRSSRKERDMGWFQQLSQLLPASQQDASVSSGSNNNIPTAMDNNDSLSAESPFTVATLPLPNRNNRTSNANISITSSAHSIDLGVLASNSNSAGGGGSGLFDFGGGFGGDEEQDILLNHQQQPESFRENEFVLMDPNQQADLEMNFFEYDAIPEFPVDNTSIKNAEDIDKTRKKKKKRNRVGLDCDDDDDDGSIDDQEKGVHQNAFYFNVAGDEMGAVKRRRPEGGFLSPEGRDAPSVATSQLDSEGKKKRKRAKKNLVDAKTMLENKNMGIAMRDKINEEMDLFERNKERKALETKMISHVHSSYNRFSFSYGAVLQQFFKHQKHWDFSKTSTTAHPSSAIIKQKTKRRKTVGLKNQNVPRLNPMPADENNNQQDGVDHEFGAFPDDVGREFPDMDDISHSRSMEVAVAANSSLESGGGGGIDGGGESSVASRISMPWSSAAALNRRQRVVEGSVGSSLLGSDGHLSLLEEEGLVKGGAGSARSSIGGGAARGSGSASFGGSGGGGDGWSVGDSDLLLNSLNESNQSSLAFKDTADTIHGGEDSDGFLQYAKDHAERKGESHGFLIYIHILSLFVSSIASFQFSELFFAPDFSFPSLSSL
ncbi:hypothetical protein HDU99_001415 [Rhizoclosmatium hyalinum]|nr:hypothetical protein HDU99_001415 [Rhizoclosmatium hyalinum]